MNRRRITTRSMLRHVAGGLGLLMVGVGTFLVASYVVGSVQVLDESDRSWLFWGLAMAGQGIVIGGIGGLLVRWGHTSGQRERASIARSTTSPSITSMAAEPLTTPEIRTDSV